MRLQKSLIGVLVGTVACVSLAGIAHADSGKSTIAVPPAKASNPADKSQTTKKQKPATPANANSQSRGNSENAPGQAIPRPPKGPKNGGSDY